MNAFIQKHWKNILIGCVIILLGGYGIYSGIVSADYARKLRQADDDIQELGIEILASRELISQLQNYDKQFAEINRRWAERDKRLEELARSITESNRRENELNNRIAEGIGRIESGLRNAQSDIGKLGNYVDGLSISMGGSFDLIQQGIEILSGVQGSSGTPNTKP